MSGETDGKMIGCVAGRYVLSGQSSAESGGYHGENHHFFGRIWNKGYHGSVGTSRWFCKIYCGKAVIVGLILNTQKETISVSHIVMFAEKTYNAFEPVGRTKCRKERES